MSLASTLKRLNTRQIPSRPPPTSLHSTTAKSQQPQAKASLTASDNTKVSNAATLSETNLRIPPAQRPPTGRLTIALGVILCSVALVICLQWYSEASHGLSQLNQHHGAVASVRSDAPQSSLAQASLLNEANLIIKQMSRASLAGAGGAIVLLLVAGSWWRQRTYRRIGQIQDDLIDLRETLERNNTDLATQKGERRRLEAELQKITTEFDRQVEERTSKLSTSHAQLQKELNDRRQAERVMAQQAKELERSKDVLELHVQARTQELQKLQRRYESILNSAGEGIYGLDLQGRTTFVNPATAKITGWKVEELVGKSECEVFHRLADGTTGPEARGNGEAADYQLFYRKDGSSFPAEYVRTPIKEKDKEVGAVVIFKDITERKRAEETLSRKAAELARSNAELEQFAYVASHDLQEPLRKIQAFGDRLKTKCDAVNLQDGRDYLERMQSAAARMQTLINDLLTFSRVISASQPFVAVDLNVVTKGVLSDLEVRIEQKKAIIEIEDLPTIEGDPLQMRQLLQNLIGNALKFQKPDVQPVVTISAKVLKSPFAGTPDEDPYAEQCELTIKDNGIGFDEKYLDKIFAVFQRLHGRNEFEGTGVGLAVCRRITDRHGGTINAKSTLGEGAAFIVTVPVRHPNKELAP
jgi:PAS domain S-box-containing protein